MNNPTDLRLGKRGPEQLATKKEIAALLRVTQRTVEVMVAEGRIPALRYGRTVRFKISDVLAAGQP